MTLKIGMLVRVGPAYVQTLPGPGMQQVADSWAGSTYRVVGFDGRDALLAPPELKDATAEDYEVALNVGRLTPLEEA